MLRMKLMKSLERQQRWLKCARSQGLVLGSYAPGLCLLMTCFLGRTAADMEMKKVESLEESWCPSLSEAVFCRQSRSEWHWQGSLILETVVFARLAVPGGGPVL